VGCASYQRAASSNLELSKMAKLLSPLIRKHLFVCDLKYYLIRSNSSSALFNSVTFSSIENNKIVLHHRRFYSSEDGKEKTLQTQSSSQQLSEDVKPITFKTVKETTKTASYLGVILLGVGVTGMIFFTVFSELFSSKSPNNVYSKALERVCNDTRVQDALGEPISGYGEENRRGRRQHVSHLLYEKEGEKRLRMKFYVNGTRKRATVHLEMKEDESGKYVYRYLFVELDDFGRHPIVFEDNRHSQPRQQPQPGSSPQPAPKSFDELDLSQPINMNLNFPDSGMK